MGPFDVLIVYGAAGVVPTVTAFGAAALALHHRARSSVAACARAGSASIREGRALLRGQVEDDDDAPPGPAVLVDVSAHEGDDKLRQSPPITRARPFLLRFASGAAVRVAPEEGRWRLETTFHATARDNEPRFEAGVHAGDTIYVEGDVRREIDPRTASKGYRDAAPAWVVRAPADRDLLFSSEHLIAQHARRARFHARWALVLATLTAWIQGGIFADFHHRVALVGWHAYRVGGGAAWLAVLVVGSAILGYWRMAERTKPWLVRRATLS